jgi:hypothetical protein
VSATKPAIWTRGDWNAFFGFGTNILVNLLTLTGLLRFVLKMPEQLVFGRILPATGMMLFLSTNLLFILSEETIGKIRGLRIVEKWTCFTRPTRQGQRRLMQRS